MCPPLLLKAQPWPELSQRTLYPVDEIDGKLRGLLHLIPVKDYGTLLVADFLKSTLLPTSLGDELFFYDDEVKEQLEEPIVLPPTPY